MGHGDSSVAWLVTSARVPPPTNVLEITLIGPGYGESVVLHVGRNKWIIVDSCEDEVGYPQPLRYLHDMQVDAASSVALVVATHWHDDHIRGMGQLVAECRAATFVCASAFLKHEFLTAVQALEERHLSSAGSGFREIFSVFSTLRRRRAQPLLAIADRHVLSDGDCDVWSLSPSDAVVVDFFRSIVDGRVQEGERKDRVPTLTPNRTSVALWVSVRDAAALLGGDLPREEWLTILEHRRGPRGMADVFKIPHHGSPDADVPRVWTEMLDPQPYAILTPWHRGGMSRPTSTDARRLLSYSKHVYATTRDRRRALRSRQRSGVIRRTIAGTGIDVRSAVTSVGAIRLRKAIGKAENWKVELFGGACHLKEYLDADE